MRLVNLKFLLIILLVFSPRAFSKEKVQVSATSMKLIDESLSIIDYPFYETASGYSSFSMGQSLEITKGFYNLSHLLIKTGAEKNQLKPFLTELLYLFYDFFLMPHPLIWLHEEWHRAVMSNRQIRSKNESQFFSSQVKNGVVKVSHVLDKDLISFKAQHPAEFVRMHAAGLESQIELNRKIEHDLLRIKQPPWNSSLMLVNALNNILYFDTCASKLGDASSKRLEESELKIEERDFTGLDCVAWVYDLFRSEDSYDSRGIHPSGNGIDRYRYYQDLSDKEKSYLRLARNLHILNIVSPILWTRRPFTIKETPFHLGIHHFPTSFGQAITLDFYYHGEQQLYLNSLYLYMNEKTYSLGFDFHLVDLFWQKFFINPRVFLWLQPKDSKFKTKNLKTGGLASLLIKKDSFKHLQWFLEFGYKTKGWVPALVSLDSQFFSRAGIFLSI